MDRYKISSSKFFSLGLVSVAMAGLIAITVLNATPTSVYAQNSTSSPSSPILSKSTLMGAITSIQNDVTGKTNWIVGGAYKMSNINTANPLFDATFYMIKTDGTAPHKHTISDFKMSGTPVVANNSTTFNGTSTITMKEGPVKDVPTSIKFSDESSVSIWLDSTKTKNHFGNTAIYGTQHLICNEIPSICKA
ncbi:MAG TPA: hypothetical protein VE643_06900 [Nitrososphaeraceae archaeon]|nr:hypothetical protein [Nitrososphaeraceae archaeon]